MSTEHVGEPSSDAEKQNSPNHVLSFSLVLPELGRVTWDLLLALYSGITCGGGWRGSYGVLRIKPRLAVYKASVPPSEQI